MKPPTGGPSTGSEQRRHGQPGHRGDQLLLGRGAQQDQPADRHHHRAADALQDPRADQERQRCRLGRTGSSRW